MGLYPMSSPRVSCSSSSCDFTKSVNAKLLCSWYWISCCCNTVIKTLKSPCHDYCASHSINSARPIHLVSLTKRDTRSCLLKPQHTFFKCVISYHRPAITTCSVFVKITSLATELIKKKHTQADKRKIQFWWEN